MKAKIDKILEISLRSYLAIMFVFGTLQFAFIATSTLFGLEYNLLQYLASLVLLANGLVCIRLLVNILA